MTSLNLTTDFLYYHTSKPSPWFPQNYTVLFVCLPTWYLQFWLHWFLIFHSYLLNGVLHHSSCFYLCSIIDNAHWRKRLLSSPFLAPGLGQRMAHWIDQFQGPRLGPVCYQVNSALSAILMSLPGARFPRLPFSLIKRSSWSLAPSISGCW